MGIVGNCSILAYIDLRADVRWMCLPRFDSSFIFGSLLDSGRGGEFSITPFEKDYQSRQYYVRNTNILVTEFTISQGVFRVVDFAPRFYQYDRISGRRPCSARLKLFPGIPILSYAVIPWVNMGA